MLESQPNFRDLGGPPTTDGHTVRHGVLFRSGELSSTTPPDLARLTGLALDTVVDLRSDAEVAERGEDRLPDGVSPVRLPVSQADQVQSELGSRFESGDFLAPPGDYVGDIYRSLATDWMSAPASVADLVVVGRVPLVFHCTHGKDRAGVTAAFLLTALGVPRDAVMADYLESNAARAEANKEHLAGIRDMVTDRADEATARAALDWLSDLFIVRPRLLETALEAAGANDPTGSTLRSRLGLDATRHDTFRERLLD